MSRLIGGGVPSLTTQASLPTFGSSWLHAECEPALHVPFIASGRYGIAVPLLSGDQLTFRHSVGFPAIVSNASAPATAVAGLVIARTLA
jgi:hypothetical protein